MNAGSAFIMATLFSVQLGAVIAVAEWGKRVPFAADGQGRTTGQWLTRITPEPSL